MTTTAILRAPPGYSLLSSLQKARICNGAGPAGDWRSKLIPNTLYGLDCTEVFNIHDYSYFTGETMGDKTYADLMMFANLLMVIKINGGMLTPLRRLRAMWYYMAVADSVRAEDAFFMGTLVSKSDRLSNLAPWERVEHIL